MVTVVHSEENAAHQIVNVAHIEGDARTGGQHVVSNSDDARVRIFHPAIAIDKTGPATATAGDKVAYTLTVTNPGDASFAESTVTVTDQKCTGDPVTLIGKGGDTSPSSLDPGDVWTYSCSVQTATGDTLIENVAQVKGCDQFGTCKTASSQQVNTVINEQLVLPERIVPGTARLTGPTGCVARAFYARVRGTKIASVVFFLDGKRVLRLHKPNLKGTYALRVNPKKLRLGVHRVVANVTFQASSRTKPKTARLSFQRCGRGLAAPRFTG
jgi:hypothetical protein